MHAICMLRNTDFMAMYIGATIEEVCYKEMFYCRRFLSETLYKKVTELHFKWTVVRTLYILRAFRLKRYVKPYLGWLSTILRIFVTYSNELTPYNHI